MMKHKILTKKRNKTNVQLRSCNNFMCSVARLNISSSITILSTKFILIFNCIIFKDLLKNIQTYTLSSYSTNRVPIVIP